MPWQSVPPMLIVTTGLLFSSFQSISSAVPGVALIGGLTGGVHYLFNGKVSITLAEMLLVSLI